MRDVLLARDADLSPGALVKYGRQLNLGVKSLKASQAQITTKARAIGKQFADRVA